MVPEVSENELFEVREPDVAAHSLRLQFARIAAAFIHRPFSRNRGSTAFRSADRRIIIVDELFHSATVLGAPLLLAQFPARLSRRQPRALRTRSAHVRRAICRPMPISARCVSPAGSGPFRGSWPRTWKSIAARFPVAGGAASASRTSTSPIMPALRRLIARTHVQFGFGGADRLPFDAGQYPRRRQPDSGRISSSATATAPALRPSFRGRPLSSWRSWFFRRPQQALCRRLHHRALRPSRARAACAADRDQSRRSISMR